MGSFAHANEYMSTDAPPADWPNRIIRFGSPPNWAILILCEQQKHFLKIGVYLLVSHPLDSDALVFEAGIEIRS
jgi:hypothetical protein